MTLSNYTREIADTICTRMSEGFSLRSICREPGMPSEGTVRGWAVRDVDGFGDRYRAARLLLMDYWADEIVDIADNVELDPRDRQIRTAVRQWIMSKVSRHYSDKVQIGGDPESPLRIMHQQASLEQLTVAQLEALERFALSLHGPADASVEHEVVERSTPALLGARQ
ncbi:MAG: hypothetical protein JO008_00075 [Alphaproteobacteria bacterium]|nr:hypothetical protein [Alphaproteobacteria bacterium]